MRTVATERDALETLEDFAAEYVLSVGMTLHVHQDLSEQALVAVEEVLERLDLCVLHQDISSSRRSASSWITSAKPAILVGVRPVACMRR